MDASTSATETIPLLKQTEKSLNLFQKFWDKLDWDKILGTVISKGLSIIIILIIIGITRKIILKVLANSFSNYKKKQSTNVGRIDTLETVARNFLQYFLFFIAIYAVLTITGVPVGSLIAGAGIAGVAIGLGAQGFISDVISGFFIIYERQLDVGDHVLINSIEGTVTQVGLRTTQVKSFNGTVNFIPNREILTVSNLSRGDQQVLIDVRVNPEDDIEKVKDLILEVNEHIRENIPELKSEITIVGLVNLENGSFAVRVVAYAEAGTQFTVKTKLTTAYIEKLTANGITIPSSPIKLV
ncbi:mechanosensitive ion channel family protein [Vagococcus sp.]|uniref:mechanosensitive ion channel family protein n=1 Tax=Vagococcus sp. TaxID=1933889 RepID=UPI003F9B0C5D